MVVWKLISSFIHEFAKIQLFNYHVAFQVLFIFLSKLIKVVLEIDNKGYCHILWEYKKGCWATNPWRRQKKVETKNNGETIVKIKKGTQTVVWKTVFLELPMPIFLKIRLLSMKVCLGNFYYLLFRHPSVKFGPLMKGLPR